MKKAPLFTADGRLNTKQHRAKDCRLQMEQAAPTYKSISTKEALCFEYLKSFLAQFGALYPKRRLPYMIALNEYGVQKFVCTTIRPSQVPFQDLYDLHECASFLAGYMLYEPLDPPFAPPEVLFSPTQSLDSHTGDAFDCATVLCSFLAGAGYDAYVVYGYAPKYITLRDQSSLPCPIITTTAAATSSSSSSGSSSSSSSGGAHQHQHMAPASSEANAGEDEGLRGYKPLDNDAKSSVFLKQQEESRLEAKQDSFTLWTELPAPPRQDDPPLEKRVHAWVLVRTGHREVREHCFVEPSTGRVYNTRTSPYTGIEAVWSAKNYFVNMQGFNGQKKVPELSFDLADPKLWEPLFVLNVARATETDPSAEAAPEQGDALLDVARTFDCPLTWCSPLRMDRQRYLMRFPPTGRRTVQYSRSKASFFARGVNAQAMTTRVVEYLDNECTLVKAIHEIFEHRQVRVREMQSSLPFFCFSSFSFFFFSSSSSSIPHLHLTPSHFPRRTSSTSVPASSSTVTTTKSTTTQAARATSRPGPVAQASPSTWTFLSTAAWTAYIAARSRLGTRSQSTSPSGATFSRRGSCM